MQDKASPRQRLSRDERHTQLIETARRLVLQAGTDSLTLGRLAEEAGVSKPVVYDHFETRNALLAALYADYDIRQSELMDRGLAACPATLADRAGVIANAYIDCVLTQGQEIPGVAAALVGSPEMEAVIRSYQGRFIAKCREALAPFSEDGSIATASLWGMMGAADALSNATTYGEISKQQALDELLYTIMTMVRRETALLNTKG
jgi:AcrR family transcriptional regulator